MPTVSTADLNSMASLLLGSGNPTSLYARLFYDATDGLTGGTEVSTSGTGYAAVTIANNTTNFPAPTTGVVTLGVAISFPKSTTAWHTTGHPINCMRLYTAATGGTLRMGAIISPTMTVDGANVTIVIEAGALTFTVASP